MDVESKSLTIIQEQTPLALPVRPGLIVAAGEAGEFAWDEFFSGQIRNRYTRAAYLHAVRQFLNWAEPQGRTIDKITPGMVGKYFDQHPGSVPTKKLHLSAIRAFFDVLVNRHVMFLNPAATVRGERYQAVEGKTPEISRDQARTLLASIDTSRPVGLRDKAIIATLIYTAIYGDPWWCRRRITAPGRSIRRHAIQLAVQ